MGTQSRKVYYRDENFSLEFEWFGGDILLHCTVNKFSVEIVKQGYIVFGMMLNECKDAGVNRVFTVTPNPKFSRMFGGVKVNELEYLEKKYEVIEWDLKQPL